MENLSLKRNHTSISWFQDELNKSGMSYTLKHGTYTTVIEHSLGKIRFQVNNYKSKVFAVANKIKKEVKESKRGQEIMNMPHQKKNYGFKREIDNIRREKVLNIDLSSAYAYCLYNSGIITKKTFSMLQSLSKEERLPAVGMLATSNVTYFYQNGKCTDFKSHREPTAEIFFHLIDEIDYIMQDIKFMLGKHYIFHWVDGIFFNYETPVKTIDAIEKYLDDIKYPYKYENVDNFQLTKIEDKIIITMIKNGKSKKYQFGTGATARYIGSQLARRAQKDIQNTLDEGRNNTQDQVSSSEIIA